MGEAGIGFLRTSFFAARSFHDVDDVNAHFRHWRDEVAHARRCPGDETHMVAEALSSERASLLPLPAHPFESDLLRVVSSGKTPYVRFDRNLYSIPHELVRRALTRVASDVTVRLLDGQREVARHARSYGTPEVIEDPASRRSCAISAPPANSPVAIGFAPRSRRPTGSSRCWRASAPRRFLRMIEHFPAKSPT